MTNAQHRGWWNATRTDEHPVRVDFGNGAAEYTTVDHACDVLDFIDEATGRADLLAGLAFRSHTGSAYQYEPAR